MSMKRIRDLSIKWKMVFTITVVSMVALLVAGALLFTYEYSAVQSMMEHDVEAIANLSAANSTAALSFDDPKAAEDTLSAMAAKPAIELACLYDNEGHLFAAYYRNGQKEQIPERPRTDGFDRSSRKLSLFSPVKLKTKRIGTLYVQSDLSQLTDWLKAYAAVSGGIVLMNAALAFALASVLQKPFLAPIVGLAVTARKVSTNKDYTLRGEKQGDDELGFLVDQFNEMLSQIQVRDKALEEARLELEQRVEARTRDLKEANKELEAFSYSVAHDLRAPLRGIDGFSQVMLEDYATQIDATGQDYLQRIRKATQRMAQLLDDMLNLSKVTRVNITLKEVNLTEIAKSILEDLRRHDAKREVEFIAEKQLLVKGDAGLLRNVLENLVGNAWKFTGKQPEARIELGMTQIDGKDTYYVRDNGAGFDMTYASKLFGVFHRLHSAAEFPGTGVGLATVQRIINRHGGKIWAEAAVGKGATFYFTLPG